MLESRLIAPGDREVIGDIKKVLPEIKGRYGNESFLAVKLNMLYSYAQLQAGSPTVSRLYILFYGESYIKHGKEMLLLERFRTLAKQRRDAQIVAMLDELFAHALSMKKPQTVYGEPEEQHKQAAAKAIKEYEEDKAYLSFKNPKEQVEKKWAELRAVLEAAKPGHDRAEQDAMLREICVSGVNVKSDLEDCNRQPSRLDYEVY